MVALVLMFVVVIIWVVVSLYGSQTKSKLPDNIKELSQPLTPTFDRSTLEMIKLKPSFVASELEDFPIYKLIFDKQANKDRVVTIEMDEEDLAAATPTPVPTAIPTVAAAPLETFPSLPTSVGPVEATSTPIPQAGIGENIQ